MDSKELYLFDDNDLISKQNKKPSKRDDYAAFAEKFKPKKTTDDCYTPENIYNAVADWVANEYGLNRDKFVRPFWPGGDFESFDYPEDCIVVDNPPFSIQAKIIRFYNSNNIKFFLFANGLTLFSAINSCCGVVVGLNMIYQNGAFINTSFLTNLESCAVRSAPTLYEVLKIENDKNLRKQKKSLPKYQYPAHILTSSMLAQFSQRGIDFKADSDEVFKIHALDSQKQLNHAGIFGYAFLLSDVKAAEKLKAEKLAADRLRANRLRAEKLAEKEIIEWTLSDREREIIAGLGKSKFL